MKKLFFLFLACCPFIFSHAADPEFYGNFLTALEEKDPAERARKIVHALEKSSDGNRRDALEMLTAAIMETGARHDLFIRMVALWDKYPAEQALSRFCINYAFAYKDYPDSYINTLEKSLYSVDYDALLGERELVSAFQSLDHFNTILIEHGQADRAAGVLDKLRKKHPANDIVMTVAVNNAVSGLFHTHSLLPEMPEFAELPDSDPWKIRIRQISGELLKISPDNGGNAVSLVECAEKLNMPETPDLLKKYVSAYPEQLWAPVSAAVAKKFKNHRLFVPAGDNDFANFLYLLTIRNFPAARRMIKKFPDHQEEMMLMFKSARSNHKEVIQTLLEKSEKISRMMPITLLLTGHSIQIENSSAALENLFNAIKQNPGLRSNPALCNTAAYLAAEMNIQLDEAENFAIYAVQKDPQNSAFLDTLAWVLYRRGKIDKAEKIIGFALKNIPIQRNSCVLYLHAARIKAAMNKPAEAAALLAKAKRLYSPEDEDSSEYSVELQKEVENLLK